MPYVRFPFTSRVVAMKMLSFRLKGGGRSSGGSGKRGSGGGDRAGTLYQCAAHSRVVSCAEVKRSAQQQQQQLRTISHKSIFRADSACPPVVARQIVFQPVGRA